MAIKYFDTNGTTAGFGSYSGQSWAGSFWTDSTAGTTPAPTAYTFNAADTAQFGRTGTTVTSAGTITAPAVNFVVGTIKTENLPGSAFRINYGGGTCLLAMGANLITFDMGSQMYFEPPISGTVGLRYQGSAILELAADVYNLTGTITNAGTNWLVWTPWTDNQVLFNTPVTYNVGTNGVNLLKNNLAKTNITVKANFAGNGMFQLQGDGSATPMLATIDGTTANLTDYTGVYAARGIGVWSRGTLVLTKDLPRTLNFGSDLGGGTVTIRSQLPEGTSVTSFDTTAILSTFGAQYIGLFESSGSVPISFGNPTTGSVRKDLANAPATPVTVALGGTNTGDNVMLYGAIATGAAAGALKFDKVGAGKWILEGDNSNLTSNFNISGGTLKARSSTALGSGAAAVVSSATLEISNGITISRPFSTTGTIRNTDGNNTLSGDVTLAGATVIESAAGSLALSGLIAGSATLSKSGAALVTLSNTSNSFTSSPSISAGTLAIPAIAALGAGSGLTLSGNGVLRYTGSTGATLSRTLTAGSITGGFENNGSGSLAVTAGSITGTSTVKLGGTGAGQYNTLGVTVAAGGFTKEGPGRWISTAVNNLSGTTTVSAGTLMAAPSAVTATEKLLGGNVTVAAGAKIQIGSDNNQKGRNYYTNLTFAGTSGTPAKIRIGGSAVNPTVQMSGNLTLPVAPAQTTFDLSADVFKTPGEYTLVEFTGSGAVVNWSGGTNITTGSTLATGRSASFAYDSVSTPKTLKVTIS